MMITVQPLDYFIQMETFILIQKKDYSKGALLQMNSRWL